PLSPVWERGWGEGAAAPPLLPQRERGLGSEGKPMSESSAELKREIAELEASLKLPLPAAARREIQSRLHELRAVGRVAAAAQHMQTGDTGTIVNPMQISAGGDVRDNLVLRDITIAEGGTLVVGSPPADLPPQPAEVQRALAAYLRTLLERYQFL